jgi:mannose-6-phosphate isomerase
MAIERANVRVVRKPWGLDDLHPWSSIDASGDAVGELWFERVDPDAPLPMLLLKLLFTNASLSIQVHPDDTAARAQGLPNGKTEAWYILSAVPTAQVAVGLKEHLTSQELRAAIRDGSIADRVEWRSVSKGDVIFVPAGTIHAIGAGIVLAEIQQRSDTTYRLFDYGRQRELHEDSAVAVSDTGPALIQPGPRRLSMERMLLASNAYFVLERIDLLANSSWVLNAELETWFLVLDGHAAIGLPAASVGEAIFVSDEQTSIEVGADGFSGLIAYPGPDPIPSLLQEMAAHSIMPTPFPPFAEIEVRS